MKTFVKKISPVGNVFCLNIEATVTQDELDIVLDSMKKDGIVDIELPMPEETEKT